MRLALLTVGYADGCSESGQSLLACWCVDNGGADCWPGQAWTTPSSMLTEIPDVVEGDEVVIIGSQGSETITAYDHAAAAGTIPWEITDADQFAHSASRSLAGYFFRSTG